MLAVKIAVIVMGVIALFMTFKAEFILENILHRDATDKAVLRVKYAAFGVAVIAFLAIFLLDQSGGM